MEIIYLLIPLAVLLVVFIVGGFLWAVRRNQFEDLEGPAHTILMDDDEPQDSSYKNKNQGNSHGKES